MITESIALGLVVSLLFSQTLGLATGGMVVPGYLALQIHHPLRLLGTVACALAAYALLRLLSNYMFIYGRRRTVLMIVLGFVLGALARKVLAFPPAEASGLEPIGLIVPGLIADWMERQGVLPTLASMLLGTVLVRLGLIVLTWGNL